MSSQVKLIQNVAGGITKSNLTKVGLGEAINMYPEVQSNDQSCTILNRTIQGTVKAADIAGKCRGMYRVSRGYDNRPVLYAVYGNSLYLIRHDNTYDRIATIHLTVQNAT